MASPGRKETRKIKFKIKPRSSRDGDGGDATPPPPPPPPLLPLVPPMSSSRHPTVHSTSPFLPPPPADQDTGEVPDDEDWGHEDWGQEEDEDDWGKEEDEGDWGQEEDEGDWGQEEDEGDWGQEEDEEDWEAVEDDQDDCGQEQDEGDWGQEEDDEDWEAVEDDQDGGKEKLTKSSDNKFFTTVFMRVLKNIPHYIVRYDSVPLNKYKYFSLRTTWNQLLDGKRTYLRPKKDHRRRVLKYAFRCPDDRPRTLSCQEPLLALVQEYPNNYIIQEMIEILSHHYVLVRRTRGDGTCFYRAFLFSYLENLGKMQDSQAEVTRLMECVATSWENFCRLKWEKAYFLNPEEYFSSVFSEFSHLVNSVANGLSSDELYKRSLEEIMPLRVLSFLRLLAETEIRTREEDYNSVIPKEMNVLQVCWKVVRPMDVEALTIPMRALTYALGIPLRVEAVGGGLTNGAVQVKRLDFFPRSESGKGLLHLVQSYHSSSRIAQPLEQRIGTLLSSDGTPLLTLLCRRGHCDILYRK